MFPSKDRDLPDRQNTWIQHFHARSLGLLVMTPLLAFDSIMAFFTFIYADCSIVAWSWVVACTIMSFVIFFLPNKRPDDRGFYHKLGVLCLVSTALGALFGFYNWNKYMKMDAAYRGQREYTNVLATEPALSHLDAGKIAFSPGTKLDLSLAGGYKGDDGNMYCVAPIVASSTETMPKIEYYAAGIDCCSRSRKSRDSSQHEIRLNEKDDAFHFFCDAADDPQAHSGLVFLRSHWERELHGFQKAASVHGLNASPDALFVSWVRNPFTVAGRFQNDGTICFILVCFIHMVLCVAVGFAIHYCQRRSHPARMVSKSVYDSKPFA